MHLRQQNGVPQAEHGSTPAVSPMPDWEAVHMFLEVAQRGSFRSAAKRLGQSINSLRRRVAELERQLQVTLFTRHVDGVRTTPEGEQILAAAQDIEVAFFNLIRAKDRATPSIAGEVKIAVTEGLGAYWVAPRIVEFQRAYPKLLIDLSCATRSVDVLRLEADVSVQLTKPTAADLKVVRLGRLHLMPFAAPIYARTHGLPKTLDDIRSRHRVVWLVSDQGQGRELYDRHFPQMPQPGFVSIRTNTSSTHYWAIASGAGIGWLATYAYALGAKIIPVDVDPRIPFDIWLTYHADAGRIPRVRYTIDWLIDAFDPRRFPWFRDEFIHPDDLLKAYQGDALFNPFGTVPINDPSWNELCAAARAGTAAP